MKNLLLLLVLMWCGSLTLCAQDTDGYEREKRTASANVNFMLGIPQGIFAERQLFTGFGFGGNVVFEVKKPLSVGLDVGWQRYDSENDFFSEFDEFGFEVITEEEASNQILSLHGLVRVQPAVNFFLQPYAEGTFGFNRFYTRTTFTDADTDEQFNSVNENSDWALSYGGAAGVLINVWQNLLFVDLRCAYRLGNTAEYFTRIEGRDVPIPIENFELQRSPTNMLIPQIGITFLLNDPDWEEEEEEQEETF